MPMIESRDDLIRYLEEDRRAYGKPAALPLRKRVAGLVFRDRFYEYMRCLRHLEYHMNTRKGGFSGIGTRGGSVA